MGHKGTMGPAQEDGGQQRSISTPNPVPKPDMQARFGLEKATPWFRLVTGTKQSNRSGQGNDLWDHTEWEGGVVPPTGLSPRYTVCTRVVTSHIGVPVPIEGLRWWKLQEEGERVNAGLPGHWYQAGMAHSPSSTMRAARQAFP